MVNRSPLVQVCEGFRASELTTWNEQLSTERMLIEDYLDTKSVPVYGFNTLFGPLDGNSLREGDQVRLFHSHLVGYPEVVDAEMIRLITRVKIRQLANGGSGISPKTFSQLCHLSETLTEGAIDFDASYSSGDVVPATWWIKSLGVDIATMSAGDLICLMNGNFISTSVAISNYQTLKGVVVDILDNLLQTNNKIAQRESGTSSGKQLSVALRDSAQVRSELEGTFQQYVDAIEMRLGNFSGNPKFVFNDDGASHYSQSSFLDFRLNNATKSLHEALSVAIGYLRRQIFFQLEESANYDSSQIKLVQPPKVCTAYVLEFSQPLFSGPYFGSESNGVEDIWDWSLHCARDFSQRIKVLKKFINLYTEGLMRIS